MSKYIVKVDIDLKNLIPGFLKNRELDIQRLENALQEDDFETIRIIGHSMKGFGSGYGFHFISEIGKVLEIAGQESDYEKAKDCIEQIKDFMDHLKIQYE